jgi:hypothetical protein
MFQTNNSIVKLTFTGDIVKKERYTPRFGPEHSVTMDTSQTEMSFIGKKLYAWGTSLISAFIPKCPQLTRLILHSNIMTGGTADNIAGISDLCDRLSTNTSLLHVSVSNNYLRLAAVKQLARMVTKNTTMTSLNMYGNQIQVDEFAHNPYNILTDKPAWLTSQQEHSHNVTGILQMAAALRQNTALTKLTVGIPGMLESSMTTADLTGMLGAKEKEGYEGAMLLAAFLPRLKVLRTLTVSKFALPIQELRTATAVDLSGKELCGLDAIFIAGLIPGNRYYPSALRAATAMSDQNCVCS